jgi:hypothetical protein
MEREQIMSTHHVLRCCLFILTAFVLSGFAGGTSGTGDEKSESVQSKALKSRRATPSKSDFDTSVTLAGLLDKKGENDRSHSKAAVIEGYVIQVEKEEDGDFHIALADSIHENNTNKWVVVEVTSAWRKRKASLSDVHLRPLCEKKIRVTGWLFFDTDPDRGDPCGTRWELHPVTNIVVID